MTRLFSAFMVGAVATLGACSDTSFQGGGGKRAGDLATKAPGTGGPSGAPGATSDGTTARDLKLACANGTGDAHLVTNLTGAKSTTVRLDGEFCGVSTGGGQGKLTVLFILDYSGSMESNDPDNGGSCGRLQAAQVITSKLQAQRGVGDNIQVGVQPFGDTALAPIAPVSLDAFQGNLSDQVFCRNDGGTTNYDSAFRAATQLLQGAGGTTIVYFITDGVPNRSGDGSGGFFGGNQDQARQLQDAYNLGLSSAAALRQLPNTTLNALILADQTGQRSNAVPGFNAPDPTAYLQQVAGSADHAKQASNAQDLAAQIQQFAAPTATTLQATSATGVLSSASFGQQTVTLASVQKDPTRSGVWTFQTVPFQLLGNGSGPAENDVTISIKGTDGTVYKATAVINFSVDASASTN